MISDIKPVLHVSLLNSFLKNIVVKPTFFLLLDNNHDLKNSVNKFNKKQIKYISYEKSLHLLFCLYHFSSVYC